MNNEEKILSLLERHDTQFEKINATLDKHSELLAQLGHEVVKINVTLENQIVPLLPFGSKSLYSR